MSFLENIPQVKCCYWKCPHSSPSAWVRGGSSADAANFVFLFLKYNTLEVLAQNQLYFSIIHFYDEK